VTTLTQPYDDAFFPEHQGRARMSAEVVVPMVMELVRPLSVTDLGCGLGTWLSVFREAGVEDVLGVDGGTCAWSHWRFRRRGSRHLEQSPPLLAEHRFTGSVMSVVHPLRFQEWVDWGLGQSRLCWERSQGR
jgi:hypothetical protein